MGKAPVYKPPKKGGSKKPDYWARFKREYNIDAETAAKVRQAAKDGHIDPTYLAAYLYRTRSLHLGLQAMKNVAFREATSRGATRPAIVDWLTGQKGFHKWEALPYTTQKGQTQREKRALNLKNPMVFVHGKQIKVGGVVPVRSSDFNQYWQTYNNMFQYYLGRNAHKGEVARILQSGKISKYAIIKRLAAQPGFYNGYAWKQHAGSYRGVYAGIYGPDSKAPRKVIKKAILNNWDQTAFEQYLRHLPQYAHSAEVQHNMNQLSSVYYQIMGPSTKKADQKTIDGILRSAAIHGWDQVQLSSWLRDPNKNPNYGNSLEQRTLLNQVAGSFGLDGDQFFRKDNNEDFTPGEPPPPVAQAGSGPVGSGPTGEEL